MPDKQKTDVIEDTMSRYINGAADLAREASRREMGLRFSVYAKGTIVDLNAPEILAVIQRSVAVGLRHAADTLDRRAERTEKDGADERWAKEAADRAFPGVEDD